jgi:hypothetical protein
LAYIGRLQTLHVELIVNVLFYLEGAWMHGTELLYNLGAEEPFENLNLYMMWAYFYRDRFMDQKMQYIDWKFLHSLHKDINYFFLIFNFILKMSEININLIESYISCYVAIFDKHVQFWFQGYVNRALSSLIQPSPPKGDHFHVTPSFIKYLKNLLHGLGNIYTGW